MAVAHLAVYVEALAHFFSSTSREGAVLYSAASLQEETWAPPQEEMKTRRRRPPQAHSPTHLYYSVSSLIHVFLHSWTYIWVGVTAGSSSELKTAAECRRSCKHPAGASRDERP